MKPVIVIGAGAAGLAAANEVAAGGLEVVVLEARARAGGRILTQTADQPNGVPLELGAEFIHGRKNVLWDIVEAAGLKTHEVPNRHWQTVNGEPVENSRFWDDLEQAFGGIENSGPDRSALSWLREHSHLDNRVLQMGLEYVEGFHAAPAERMSAHALALADAAAEANEEQRAFRVQNGYGEVIGWFLKRLFARRVSVNFNTVVKTVRWEGGSVEVGALTRDGFRTFEGSRLVVTLPLGVLKSREEGGVVFDPPLTEKEEAIEGLEMGHIVKVTLRFRAPFWPVDNFGFIHTDDEWLPTWWSDERGAVLTGWAGGLRAEWLGNEDDEAVIAEGIRALGQIFQRDSGEIRDLLEQGARHDWTHDPFSRGAYSYTPVGMIQAPGSLGTPIDHTIFFAGEATDTHGEQGTVHGAIGSGKRVAREILESVRSHRIVTHVLR